VTEALVEATKSTFGEFPSLERAVIPPYENTFVSPKRR
jgi:hypothetical protein